MHKNSPTSICKIKNFSWGLWGNTPRSWLKGDGVREGRGGDGKGLPCTHKVWEEIDAYGPMDAVISFTLKHI